MVVILSMDGSDDVVSAAFNMLLNAWPFAQICDYSQVDAFPDGNGEAVYVVGHANAVTGFSEVDLRDVDHLTERFTRLLSSSRQVVLVACSTANEAQQLLDGGFVAATYAQNLSSRLEVDVVGASGPVVVNDFSLAVDGLTAGWEISRSGSAPELCQNPIGDGGDPTTGNGDGVPDRESDSAE